jgi:para-aminobenzoate synthetase
VAILLIDNYDSFTYNLAQLIASESGSFPIVVKNDALTPTSLAKLSYDAVVLSPGPGRPDRLRDFGICNTLILRGDAPILGVCLGHQGIAHAFGAKVTHAPEPMHGRSSAIYHSGTGLFEGLPSPFSGVRYHSLLVEALPNSLRIDARTEDGLIMALSHRSRQFWGVQFHPESISTDYGGHLIANFLKLAGLSRTTVSASRKGHMTARQQPSKFKLKMSVRELRGITSKDCFHKLYSTSEYSFWLDSSSAGAGQGRYSYMGDANGPHAKVLRYDCHAKHLQIQQASKSEARPISLFDYLKEESHRLLVDSPPSYPCPFKGGYVGYFGYEMKAECGGTMVHQSLHDDGAFLFADRFLAFDEIEANGWMVCLHERESQAEVEAWFEKTIASLAEPTTAVPSVHPTGEDAQKWMTAPFLPRHPQSTYISLIERALQDIIDGESYEICLTNQWMSQFSGDPLALYLRLRAVNPAPYSAYLSFGTFKILSCSPESFLQISSDGRAECKPIKGTIQRGKSPDIDAALANQLRTSVKDRAENLMIVDLIRNDMNRVCKTGSVQVAKLYGIESFEAVHQMVSTVVGEIADDISPIDVIRSLFPGGSMTGAPKIRTMELIDNFEVGPRGPYSGALGYLSLDGAVRLNIVIRTLVIDDDQIYLGTGGAIVALSDPVAEHKETLIKVDNIVRVAHGKGLL